MIVLDASVLIELLLRGPDAPRIEDRLFQPGETLHAPHLIDLEIAQVLRRYAARGEIDGERGEALLADLADFPIRRYPHDVVLLRVWELRHNLTAYDACYVALAESLGGPLVTRDRHLAASPGHSATVEAI